MQDVKPDSVEGCGSKSAVTFLQSWLRRVTSSDSLSTGVVPQSASGRTTRSSKRRKGRPRKYVAAAGDRTLTGDALLIDTASDSGLARCSVIPLSLSPPQLLQQATNLTVDRPPPPPAAQKPTTSGEKTRVVRRTKVGRRKDNVDQRGKRQPVKFIPAAKRCPPMKSRRRKSSTTTSSQVNVAAVDSAVKRPRGRPRKHPALPVFAAAQCASAVRKAVPDVPVAVPRRHFTDVESDSGDSDVIVTGYTAPRDVTAGLRQPTRGAPASVDGNKRTGTTGARSRSQSQTRSVSKLPVSMEVVQPVKRKRGRPRKYPLPTNAVVAVNNSSSRRRSAAATQHSKAAAESRDATDERRRVTRALTAAQTQRQWDTTRLAAESSSITPARNTPPLYYELSSSDNEEPQPDFRSDVDRCPNNFGRKRKRRRSIPSRSLELSFSSIEKDDAGSGESACYPTSGRSRDREFYGATEMTSTPRYDRSTSVKDSTLRSRWINVEHRAMEMTTTTAVVHRDADGQTASTTSVPQSNTTRITATTSQCLGSDAVHRRKRRRGRSNINEDPDWRRYPTKPSRRSSRGDIGPPSASTGSTNPVTTSDGGGNDDAYDEAQLDILVELQRRLASTSDGHVLRQVVEIIEASGRYQVEDATFDFDLCSLDRGTITKLRRCLAV